MDKEASVFTQSRDLYGNSVYECLFLCIRVGVKSQFSGFLPKTKFVSTTSDFFFLSLNYPLVFLFFLFLKFLYLFSS